VEGAEGPSTVNEPTTPTAADLSPRGPVFTDPSPQGSPSTSPPKERLRMKFDSMAAAQQLGATHDRDGAPLSPRHAQPASPGAPEGEDETLRDVRRELKQLQEEMRVVLKAQRRLTSQHGNGLDNTTDKQVRE
jgi:hypothetical protein